MRSLSPSTAAKLFAAGFTVGPVVDSLHNQCLLRYHTLPISLTWPTESIAQFSDYPFFFCSSWTVPPLLGIAYVILGGLLPRLFENLSSLAGRRDDQKYSSSSSLRNKAWIAVTTTAAIIKLSEFLETHPDATNGWMESIAGGPAVAHVLVMMTAALIQWALLDGSFIALLVASITAIGGPLSELPFVAHGVWEYLPTASDYFPLADLPLSLDSIATSTLGESYRDLGLSSITGPCYFAVTMDAIALGRWLDVASDNQDDYNVVP